MMKIVQHPQSVMAALEAAIHPARVHAPIETLSLADARAMGGRVKPGHDA
jgi:hypothetical protein